MLSIYLVLYDSQRRRLAILAKRVGRKALSGITCAFSPDTILMWHRKLVANKYDGSQHRSKFGKEPPFVTVPYYFVDMVKLLRYILDCA